MSADDTQIQKPHGFLYRMTETLLGVASAASLVMAFIPALNFIGAIVQAGVTVVQTGMDLVTKGFKKAMWTLASGTLLTGLNLIPFLRGATGLGKGAKIAEEGAALAAGSTKAVAAGAEAGVIAGDVATVTKAPSGISKVWKGITSRVTSVKDTIGKGINSAAKNTFGRSETITNGWTKLVAKNEKLANGFAEIGGVKKAAVWVEAHPYQSGALQAAAMVGSSGIDMMTGMTTPPANLLNPATYRSEPANDTHPDPYLPANDTQPKGEWTRRIQAERAPQTQQHAALEDVNVR